MRSQKSIVRKAQKARERRKDFVKKRNINANVPTISEIIKVDKFKSHTNVIRNPKTGRTVYDVSLQHTGTKDVVKKKKVYNNHAPGDRSIPMIDIQNRNIGMIEYPLSKKFKKPKKINKNNKK